MGEYNPNSLEDDELDELLGDFKGGTLSITDKPNENLDDKNNYVTIDNSDKINSNINHWKINNFVSPLTAVSCKFICDWWKTEKDNGKDLDNNLAVQQVSCVVEDPRNYFTFREEVIAKALYECKREFLDDDNDGPLEAAFLLTQISAWNSDKERLVLLTSKIMVIVKYDFIALKRLAYKKVPLENIEKVSIGNLVYPQASLIPRIDGLVDGVVNILENFIFSKRNKNTDKEFMKFYEFRNRNKKGIRLVWKQAKQASQWNPFTEDVPFCTFTFHPLFFNSDCNNENLRNLYNLEHFVEKICNIINNLNLNNNKDIIQNQNIVLANYVALGSVIHNRNSLGFFKVRGKFSF